jgi:hypothetical protein
MMIHANLHIGRNTSITWDSGKTTYWVSIEQEGSEVTIFVKSAEDAKRLVATLWVIREHLHPDMVNQEQAGISAERIN